MTASYARAERAALCDLFDQVGPDAPTLCAGWTTFDLAAHLVLRETRFDALPGVGLKLLSGYTAKVQRSLKAEHGYDGLVRMVRSGPAGVYRVVPGLDEAVNALEYFVHHEDVRRAQPDWEPRELSPGLEKVIWSRLRSLSRLMLRKAPVGVALHRIGGGGHAVALGGARNAARVEVTGRAGELLMFCFGRQDHARVDLAGEERAAKALMGARLGV
ncbi:TIGR03085 family protein [Sinosporangium album]|uniref:TIGR03085 family protein n=1 Tax=Sinosporangium album TaxID=504805 RepID=A0A1G7X931_9ACTN|nr:TIGR03085 family metal-binding protein [Sinosporangium album]SDG80725.1 TIGR03085 family protein [Sinosporangium album]